jgi:hypothetical protein
MNAMFQKLQVLQGYRVEEIEDKLMQRFATWISWLMNWQGRTMEKILRK